MAILEQKHWDKIIRARLILYKDQPFFARLAQYLDPVCTPEQPTMAVESSGRLHVNPEFIEKLSINDTVFILCHEVMHLVCMHLARMPIGCQPMLWNIACDIVINQMIVEAGIPLPQAEGVRPLYGGEFEKYKDWFTEPVYYDLIKNADPKEGGEGDDGNGEGGGMGGSTGTDKDGRFKGWWWDDSGARVHKDNKGGQSKQQDSQEWKKRAAAAASGAKSVGKLPGNLDLFMTELLHPKIPWEDELRMACSHAIRTGKWTWRRLGRRTAGRVRTPGRDPQLPVALVYIDTSGSMSDDEVRRCLSETARIITLCGGEIRLLLGDAEIYYDGPVDVTALTKLPMQRGGTDFTVVFDKIAETDDRPEIFIGFSDLCGPFPEFKPDFPVCWCKPKNSSWSGHAPWGHEIEVEIK